MILLWCFLVLMALVAVAFILLPLLKGNLGSNKKNIMLALVLGLIVMVVSLSIYWHAGAADKVAARQQIAELQNEPNKVIALVEERLNRNPNSVEGWYLLGKLYLNNSDYQRAVTALARAHVLVPADGNVALMYASALFLNNNQKLNGEAHALLKQVLGKSPASPLALNLLALDAFANKKYRLATDYWQQVIPQLDSDSVEAKEIAEKIAEAKQLIQ